MTALRLHSVDAPSLRRSSEVQPHNELFWRWSCCSVRGLEMAPELQVALGRSTDVNDQRRVASISAQGMGPPEAGRLCPEQKGGSHAALLPPGVPLGHLCAASPKAHSPGRIREDGRLASGSPELPAITFAFRSHLQHFPWQGELE